MKSNSTKPLYRFGFDSDDVKVGNRFRRLKLKLYTNLPDLSIFCLAIKPHIKSKSVASIKMSNIMKFLTQIEKQPKTGSLVTKTVTTTTAT